MASTSLLERTAAGRSRLDPKVACVLTLVLVFLAGGVVGGVAVDQMVHNRQRPLAFDTPQGKAQYFERLRKELDLTPTQAEQMQSVLDDFWQYYRTVLSDGKQRVEQLLTPEQRRKFEQRLQQLR